VGGETLPLRGGGGRVNPIKSKRVYYKLFLAINSKPCYILSRMTNLIIFLGSLLDCVLLTLQVLAKIVYNFSPVLFLFLAFVGIKTLVTK
jgi:hypothetical protein